jgi:nucleotide-binding universal stress UspA family protein
MTLAEHIVVGVDNSPAGAAAVRWALRRGHADRTAVVAVSAFEPPHRPRIGLHPDLASQRLTERRRAQWRVNDAVAELPSAVRVELSTPDGQALSALLDKARGAALLVVGTPTRDHRSDLVERLREASTCPVVNVDADGTAHAGPPGDHHGLLAAWSSAGRP